MPPELLAALSVDPSPKPPPEVLAVLDAPAATMEQIARATAALEKWDLDKAVVQARSAAERARRHAEKGWPPRRGREVEKIYTSLAWKHCGKRGRRQKRRAYLLKLLDFVTDAKDMARALGNTAESIYPVRFVEEFDH